MKWVELSVVTKDVCAEAVSALFYDLGCQGVVIEDPESARRCIARGEWDFYELPSGFLERDYVVVTAYFPEPGPEEQQVRAGLDRVREQCGAGYELLVSSVDENDWANFWKTYYHTLRVGQHLVIKPTWEEYHPDPDDILIELDPDMAFGTGTHATTRFCLQLIEKHLQPGMTVWDVGTGSGILSIAAALLGAGQVLALDVDPVAVRSARFNAEQNGLGHLISVQELNFLTATPEGRPDLVVANIIAEIIEQMLGKVYELLPEQGLFLVSGIIVDKWPDLMARLQEYFELVEVLEDESWVGALVRKRGQ